MPQETEFVDYITGRNRVRVRFTVDHGLPQRIMVQLECEIGGRWRPARRYDNHSGGPVHVHTMPWDRRRDRRHIIQTPDLRHAIRGLVTDLQVNWETIRAAVVTDMGADDEA
jgi:hypothetical protein